MLVVGILVIVLLVVLFISTFVIYHKMPAPKGCEDIKISEHNCATCQKECSHRINSEE